MDTYQKETFGLPKTDDCSRVDPVHRINRLHNAFMTVFDGSALGPGVAPSSS